MKQQLSKFCHYWLPASSVMFCSLTMLMAAPLLPDAPAAMAQSVQTTQVTGLVTDKQKEPLIGVTVTLVGTETRAITDADGMFRINVPSKSGTTLEFNYIGFASKQVKVNGARLLNVMLEEETNEFTEVVVTGYASQKKASVIGAIETIRPSELQFGSTRTLSNNLAGKLSGIIGIQRSGEPGYDDSNFWIRGISTFSGSNNPLILIDGVERDLNNVDVAEIESFSILKDASASAMYGVRGANGVIVITTKRGKIGAPQVNFHLEHSINQPTKMPEFMNAPDYMTLLNELATQDGVALPFTQQQIDRTRSGYDPDLYPDVNWVDAITKDYSYTTRGNLDISGGSDFLRYSIVTSYFKESGILEQDKSLIFDNSTNNQQYNLRTNIDMDVTKTTMLRVNIGGYLNRFKKQRCDTDGAFGEAFRTLPFVHPARYSDGAIPVISYRANPWRTVTQQGYDFITSSKIQTLFSVEQDLGMIIPGLKAKGLFSFDRWNRSRRSRTAKPSTVFPATGRDEEGNLIYSQYEAGDESLGNEQGNEYGNTRVYFETDLMYSHRFGKTDVDAMVLYNQQAYDDGSIQDYRKQGIAGRLSATYDNRYVAEFNFGYNGSENFAKGKRFGFFPSVAIGWLLSEEHFMEKWKSIFHKIKFRASIGQAGDDNIGGRRFAYLGTLITDAEGYKWGTNAQRDYGKGITEGEIGVDNLTWETVTKKNLGIELGLWNMLDLNFDIFSEKRKNIFMQRSIIPTQTGFVKAPWANYGQVSNHGLEMTLNFHKQWNKDFFTSAYGNFTYAKNRVDEKDEPDALKGTHRSATGRSMNELWGLTAERLFGYEDFNEDGTLKDGIPSQEGVGAAVLHPGDIKYVDVNGDGVITEADEGYIGGTEDPRIVYGFGGVISYKNVDFNFFFQGTGDMYRVIGNQPYFLPGGGTTTEGNAYSYNISDRWTEDNQDPYAFWPRLTYGPNVNNYRRSTWWKKDMSFLRCKTIEVGYTFPKTWLQNFYVKSCRVFVSGNNLFCLSAFKLWDPELGTNDGLKYPMNRSVMFGVDINF
ncbi:TonB-linked outer membrane protein, SusC/RagA family [Xylanibacter ruminicola]|uniref:TonB-linked outer membrane protein, SusC/RagA family n=2 Tax=Xylanibacter ruminicola TaxID=839 RepID=A0A1M6U506_XYLRU|nr:TonB-linked outer membrane protein, SusC/RagA family [Xylanibacter ruminicola]